MEPITTLHLLHDRTIGDSRSALFAFSLCAFVLLLLNTPTGTEAGSIQDQGMPKLSALSISCNSPNNKTCKSISSTEDNAPSSDGDSRVVLQYKVNRQWTKHAGMRRAASEPVIENQELLTANVKTTQKLRDLRWYAEREKAQIENFFAEINFLPPTTPTPPPSSTLTTIPSVDPNALPDAKLFRAAPQGWQSIMSSSVFHYYPESKSKSLSLSETGDLFAFAQNRQCSAGAGITSCKAFNAVETAAKSVVAGSPSYLAVAPKRQRGSMDALHFCGVMRLFADWRVLRQIPPSGYKTYATGITLGHKDILLNVKKIENAARAWIERRKAVQGTIRKRPTLRDLLKEEVDTNVHTRGLPKLEDESAATGLLWARRQLEYQNKLYRNFNDNSFNNNISEAVRAAYDDVYSKFHGWAVRKVFQYSAAAAPPLELLVEHMTDGESVEHGKKAMLKFSNNVEPVLEDLLGLLREFNMEDQGRA